MSNEDAGVTFVATFFEDAASADVEDGAGDDKSVPFILLFRNSSIVFESNSTSLFRDMGSCNDIIVI